MKKLLKIKKQLDDYQQLAEKMVAKNKKAI